MGGGKRAGGPGGAGLGGGPVFGGIGQGGLAGLLYQAPASTTTTPTAPTPLQTDLKKLMTDSQAVQDKSQVTPALLAAVRKDFAKIRSEATTAPDTTKLATLTSDLKAVGDALPTAAQTTQLQNDFTAVVQSEGITDQALIAQTTADLQAVVTATNISSADLATLAADRLAVQNDRGTANPGTNAPDGNAATSSPQGFAGGPGGPGAWGNGFQGASAGSGGPQRGPGPQGIPVGAFNQGWLI